MKRKDPTVWKMTRLSVSDLYMCLSFYFICKERYEQNDKAK